MNFISENILKLKKQKGTEVCSKILSEGQGKGKGSSHRRGVRDGKMNGTYITIFVDQFLSQDEKDILMEDVDNISREAVAPAPFHGHRQHEIVQVC